MNNLHRELAPISDVAWADIEAEAHRTFVRHVAARRVVDLIGPSGNTLAGVGTGHLLPLTPPADGVLARSRELQPVVEFRVPFVIDRQAVDDVERGAKDSNWQSVKDAAKQIAFAEDRAIFGGYEAAASPASAPARRMTSNAPVALPDDVREYPTAVAQALSALRLAGVDGPYSLLLPADAYTAVAETADHGTPSASTSLALSRAATSSGRRLSTTLFSLRRAVVTTNSTSARTCRSGISRTTPRRSSSISRSR